MHKLNIHYRFRELQALSGPDDGMSRDSVMRNCKVKVTRTLPDLEGADNIYTSHLAEAISH